MKIIYEIFRWLGVLSGWPFHWVFFKRKTYYEDKSVQGRRVKGGALIITNHFNPWDYVHNVFFFFPRKLYIVASEHAFKNKLQTFGMKFWGGIKCDRRVKSMRFVKESVVELQKGHLVQIFPEGHNTDDGTIKAFYPSYILIALRAKKPIIPVVTDGAYRFTKRTHLIVGKPIDLYEHLESEKYTRQDIDRLNHMVRQKVLELRQEMERRKGGKA